MVENIEIIGKAEEQKRKLRNSIYRAKKQVEKQTENLQELFYLIQKHPDLPIVAMVDSEIVADESYCYWLGKWGNAEIDILNKKTRTNCKVG